MDVDSLYKSLKQESADLINREKELARKVEDIKRLKKQNDERKKNVAALEAELKRLLG